MKVSDVEARPKAVGSPLGSPSSETLRACTPTLELVDAEYFERRDDTESRDDILYPDDIPSA